MPLCKSQHRYFLICIISLFFLSCGNKDKEKGLAETVAMDIRVSGNINKALKNILSNPGKNNDSMEIEFPEIVNEFYHGIDYKPVWCSSEKFSSLADSLYQFIAGSENEGLFPDDYHYGFLRILKDTLDADSLARLNAVLWTNADLMLTDAFMHIIKDLKQGRLKPDSVSLNKDSVLADDFFITTLNELLIKKDFSGLLTSLQPAHKSYWELKKGIKRFVDSMDRKEYTYITYPFKRTDVNDSLYFIKLLQNRLLESNCMEPGNGLPDSAGLYRAIKKYQMQKGLQADGRYGKNLVNSLNSNGLEKFKRIAVTLDRYKQLPEKMPEKYIWVNIPGNYLVLMVADTVVFESKVITGKPETRTPLLTSEISDIITYPTWTVPNSIIIKQYLPRLKNNPDYISKIGLKLVNSKGEVVDPNTVNWSKYSRGIPFKVMQASGDNNSLGVIKFNFNNLYAVYLHDTNQRYLFKNASRALSHGCVRVQEWQKLAMYIAKNDSAISSGKDSLRYTADSIKSWISKKERHTVYVKNRIPLYIRYFSCEGKNGVIKFYDDVYGEDKLLIEKYFAKKGNAMTK
jgi:L,D-transpeptidase YcbB